MAQTAGRQFKDWIRESSTKRGIFRRRVYPLAKWKIIRGDTVELISGRDAGKRGKVLLVDRKANRIVVEGTNMVKKHMRPAEGRAGGVVNIEAPMDHSNVMLVDPTIDKPVRVGFKRVDGKRIRVSKKTGAEIPLPSEGTSRTTPRRSAGPMDTPGNLVLERTYVPLE